MDIEKLCPGCMRELGAAQDAEPQRKPMQGTGIGSAQGTGDSGDGERKCPYCGFNAVTYRQNSRCLPLYTILAGKYLVGAVLGEGGFGITYIGYDLNMQTRIAIKEYFPVELVSRDTTSMTGDRVISMSGDKSETYRQGLKKYVTEAQNVSQFSEIPGVVSVKDFFYENETAYIVMEYIDGISLKDYLKERGGRLSEEESLAIMKPVLEALVKVHEAGIVHRDISPDNIMLTFQSAWDNGNIREDGNATGHGNATRHGNAAGYGTVTGYGAAAQRGVFTENTNADRLAPSGPTAAGKELAAVRTAHGESGASDMAAKGDGAASNITSVKLIDFGAARMTAKNDQKSLTIILKHGYAPEEQYRTHGEQGPWTDVYAVCAVLYRMLTGQTPVPAMDRMFQDELKSFDDLNTKVSRNTQAAILKGLAVKKEDRIQSMEELLAVLYRGKKLQGSSGYKRMRLIAGLGALALAGIGGLAVWLFRPAAPADETGPVQVTESANEAAPDNPGQDGLQTGEEADGVDDRTESSGGNGEEEAVVMDIGQEETALGETIVSYNPQYSIATDGSHILFCKPDGTVEARGYNRFGECDVQDWSHVVAVAAGGSHSLGLRSDGTVLATGYNEAGQCDVTFWKDIVQIAAAGSTTLGLTKEGKVNIAGSIDDGINWENVMKWEDIHRISFRSSEIIGVQSDGTVLREGNSHMAYGEHEWTMILGSLPEVESVQLDPFEEVIGLKKDGTIEVAVSDWTVVSGDSYPDAWTLLFGNHVDDTLEDVLEARKAEYAALPSMSQMNARSFIGVSQEGRVVFLDRLRAECSNSRQVERDEMNTELENWTDLISIYRVDGKVYGIKRDGTLAEYYHNRGNASLEDFVNLEWVDLVKDRTDLAIVGKTKDGRLLYYGSRAERGDFCRNTPGEAVSKVVLPSVGNGIGYLTDDGVWHMNDEMREEGYRTDDGEWHGVESWMPSEGIVQVVQSDDDEYAFLMKDGTVQVAPEAHDGGYRKGLHDNISQWTDIVEISYITDAELMGLTKDGEVVFANGYRLFSECKDVAAIGGGYGMWFAVRKDGTVVASEHDEYTGRDQVDSWSDIVQVSGGWSHTVGLRKDGTVVAVGKNHCGQCDVEDWEDIVFITARNNCTLGITKDGTLKMAGSLD